MTIALFGRQETRVPVKKLPQAGEGCFPRRKPSAFVPSIRSYACVRQNHENKQDSRPGQQLPDEQPRCSASKLAKSPELSHGLATICERMFEDRYSRAAHKKRVEIASEPR